MRIRKVDPDVYFHIRKAWMVESHLREDGARTLDEMERNLLEDPGTYWYFGPSKGSFFFLSDVEAGKWARFHTVNADGRAAFDDRRGSMKLVKEIMEDFDLFRLEALVPTSVTLHQSLLWHLGFKLEGRLRRKIKYEGAWTDAAVFGLLAENLEMKIKRRPRNGRRADAVADHGNEGAHGEDASRAREDDRPAVPASG